MNEITKALHEEMKANISDKTTCMIASYKETLEKTIKMMVDVLGEEKLEPEVLLKRVDMFWGMSVQKVEQERMHMNHQPPIDISDPRVKKHRGESPCEKKARESAEKIASLEEKLKDKNIEQSSE